MLSRLVITFLPRSKHLFISWLQSPSAVILEPKEIKSVTVSIVSPSISHEVMGPDAMILVFWMLSFKPTFSLSYFTFIRRLFSSSSLLSMIKCRQSFRFCVWPFYLQSTYLPLQQICESSPNFYLQSFLPFRRKFDLVKKKKIWTLEHMTWSRNCEIILAISINGDWCNNLTAT